MLNMGTRVRALIAKAGELRDNGRVFDAEALRMAAQKEPDRFEYIEATGELFGIMDIDFKMLEGGAEK